MKDDECATMTKHGIRFNFAHYVMRNLLGEPANGMRRVKMMMKKTTSESLECSFSSDFHLG